MMLSTEVQQAKTRAALISIVSNSILIVLKLIVGIMMQSVSVISEAVHSGLYLVAAIMAWFSVRESGKPADDEHLREDHSEQGEQRGERDAAENAEHHEDER